MQVIQQEYTTWDFGINGDIFVASNSFELRSTGYPMLYNRNGNNEYIRIEGKTIKGAVNSIVDLMCVRGSDTGMDDSIICIDSPAYIEKLKVAVKEYNEER